MRRIRTLRDVVEWGLCAGCGACASACPHDAITLVNHERVGIRPHVDAARCSACDTCLAICPGHEIDGEMATGPCPEPRCADREFGLTLEIWEGYAADPELRRQASSGGALSALALYCLERESMRFVLHTGSDPAKPWLNRTVQSRNRADLLSRTGSRYAPASPCDGLRSIERSDGPCVFIGKPCDTAAAWKLRRLKPVLDRNLGLVLAFFCAGTPSTRGTLDLLDTLGVNRSGVRELRYRGEGWPGDFKVSSNGDGCKRLSYKDSWGALTRYRSPRCHLCPDGLGRVADISCGDAWDKWEGTGDAGRSLILVRTPLGQQMLRRAMAAGYLEARPSTAAQVLAAQPNLLARRREILGRLIARRLLGVPEPRFKGFSLHQSWVGLPPSRKLRSVAGTAKRLFQRGTWRRELCD